MNIIFVISHPFPPEDFRGRICTKSGTAEGVIDIITCDKFFGDWLKGVDSVGGRKLPSHIDSVFAKFGTMMMILSAISKHTSYLLPL